MTASAAEMRRWRLCEEGKKREPEWEEEEEEEKEEEERKGRLVSIREGEKGGSGKARTPTRATFSRSFLRSFVRSVLCDDCR